MTGAAGTADRGVATDENCLRTEAFSCHFDGRRLFGSSMDIGFHYRGRSPILWADLDPIEYKVAVVCGNPRNRT